MPAADEGEDEDEDEDEEEEEEKLGELDRVFNLGLAASMVPVAA